jgi:hypothetical protein
LPYRDRFRVDSRGGVGYDPAMMLALLAYVYWVGERSSRRAERRCIEDVACWVLATNTASDHQNGSGSGWTTRRAWPARSDRFCRYVPVAWLVKVGWFARDGTKIAAAAVKSANDDARW